MSKVQTPERRLIPLGKKPKSTDTTETSGDLSRRILLSQQMKVLECLKPGCDEEPLSDRNSVALSPNTKLKTTLSSQSLPIHFGWQRFQVVGFKTLPFHSIIYFYLSTYIGDRTELDFYKPRALKQSYRTESSGRFLAVQSA